MQNNIHVDDHLEGMHNCKVSLETSFMGIRMQSPVIAGSSPLNINFESIRQLVMAGVGAVVLPSILQEQLIYQSMVKLNPTEAVEQSGHKPQHDLYNGGPDEYLKTIKSVKAGFQIPLIASMHGATNGEWLDFARKIEDSGADGLELNWQSGRCDPHESSAQVEARMLQWVEEVRTKVTIPIAFKMNARFTNPTSIAIQLQDIGVNGLVLFAHHPHWDIDIDRKHWTIGWELTPTTSLGRTLEGLVATCSSDLRISVAASGGVRTGKDSIKAMIAGADVVMIVSELYRQGADAVNDILAEIQRYLDTHSHPSLEAFLSSRPFFADHQNHSFRSEIVDPLTSCLDYRDPTPITKHITGDAFGHPSHE